MQNQGWKSIKDTLGEEPSQEVSLEDHCKFRYLFNYRGVAASFRFKHLFLCNSLVFHVGHEWLEYFYSSLKPWIHYVPVNSRASEAELEELIGFFQNNPDLAQEIAQNGRDIITERLEMSDIECYWENLMRRYTSLLTFRPKRNDDYIQIK